MPSAPVSPTRAYASSPAPTGKYHESAARTFVAPAASTEHRQRPPSGRARPSRSISPRWAERHNRSGRAGSSNGEADHGFQHIQCDDRIGGKGVPTMEQVQRPTSAPAARRALRDSELEVATGGQLMSSRQPSPEDTRRSVARMVNE